MNITERGNIAFNNPDTNSAILIAPTGNKDGEYIVSTFNGNNYPKWNVYTQFFYGEELQDFIQYELEGWFMDKCNGVDVNLSTGCDAMTYVMDTDEIKQDILTQVIKHAEDNDYTVNDDTIGDAILAAAEKLEFFITKRMYDECYDEIYWTTC